MPARGGGKDLDGREEGCLVCVRGVAALQQTKSVSGVRSSSREERLQEVIRCHEEIGVVPVSRLDSYGGCLDIVEDWLTACLR